MGLCSGKLGGSSSGDVLETTAWIREVVACHQRKRKGISKFSKFTFEPLGSSCHGGEDYHKVSVGFLDGKEQPQEVHWIIRVSTLKAPQSTLGPLPSECKARSSFLPELSRFLQNSSYKRARFLVNLPDLIYQEEKAFTTGKRHHLVVEDVEITKKCRPLSPSLVKAGLDLTHLHVVLATLAQFHAASLAWKQSLQDDSVLDVFPFLSKPPCPTISAQQRLDLLLKYKQILTKLHNKQLPEKLQQKLEYLQLVNTRLSQPGEAEISCVLGTVGLGAVSPLDLAFQYPTTPISQNLGKATSTPISHEGTTTASTHPACAAVTRIGNITYSTLMRDLASWVFILSSRTVRQHYLLDVISNYLIVLTNALDLLGINWEKFGINFNNFCDRFFEEAEIGLLVAVLVAMNDTSEDDLDEYLNNTDGVAEEENANLLAAKTGTIPLSPTRLQFLNHLLDDVRKFV